MDLKIVTDGKNDKTEKNWQHCNINNLMSEL